MTSIEWLKEQMNNIKGSSTSMNGTVQFIEKELNNLFEQAKEMFEEQVTLSHINGQSEFDKGAYREHNQKLANEYYNQTFKPE